MRTNETVSLLCNHVSVRDFTGEPIAPEDFDAIIEAARASSSTCFLQLTSIVRVTDPEKRAKMAVYAGNQAQVVNAAEFIVFCVDFRRDLRVCGEADLGWAEQLVAGCVDTGIMAQSALTAAESLGLGGCFIGGLRNHIREVGELLELPEHTFALVGLTLGHPAKRNDLKPRIPVSMLLSENAYRDATDEELAAYDKVLTDYYGDRGMPGTTWKGKLDPILARERRPFVQAYLNEQGFNRK